MFTPPAVFYSEDNVLLIHSTNIEHLLCTQHCSKHQKGQKCLASLLSIK
jgi:hypothetical protein